MDLHPDTADEAEGSRRISYFASESVSPEKVARSRASASPDRATLMVDKLCHELTFASGVSLPRALHRTAEKCESPPLGSVCDGPGRQKDRPACRQLLS